MKDDFTIAEDGKWTAAASAETTSLPIVERYGANFAAALFYHSRWDVKKGMQKPSEAFESGE